MKKRLALFLLAMSLTAAPIAHAQEDSELQLFLARIHLFIETHIEQAFELIESLKVKYPDNPQILMAESEAYMRIGNPRRARQLIERAHQLDPANEDIAERMKEIRRLSAPFASLNTLARYTGHDAHEKIVRLAMEGRYSDRLAVGAVLENNHIVADPLLISNGVTRGFDRHLQRVETYALYEREDGDNGKLSLFLAEGVVGTGIQYQWIGSNGWSIAEVNYNRPNWEDYIVSIVDEGTEDNVNLAHFQRLGHHLLADLNVGLHRYGLQEDSSLGSSYSFGGGLLYDFDPNNVQSLLGSESSFALRYDLDAEYVIDRDPVNGTAIMPLPMTSRQIHSLTASAGKDFGDELHAEGYGGYAYDVLGGDGPLFGATLFYTPFDALSLELRASRGIFTEQTNQKLDEVGFSVKWHFL